MGTYILSPSEPNKILFWNLYTYWNVYCLIYYRPSYSIYKFIIYSLYYPHCIIYIYIIYIDYYYWAFYFILWG